ncbi:MAG: DUF5684 domain-containing protein [Thermoleophilia bacterium]|jgi:hypothetical protein
MDSFNEFVASGPGIAGSLVMYVFLAFCLMTIANKLGTPRSWLAFIPIANVYLMCKMVGYSGVLVLLAFVPFVNFVFLIVLWWKIAEARDRTGWLGILMLVPIANVIVPILLAFTEHSGMPTGRSIHHA